MKTIFKFVSSFGRFRILMLIFLVVIGLVYSTKYKDSIVYKNPKSYSMQTLETLSSEQIPKYFILTEAVSTGDFVLHEVITQKNGISSISNYIYYPISARGKDSLLYHEACAKFLLMQATGSRQQQLSEEMLKQDFNKIEVEYINDYIEDGIANEFKKTGIILCSSPVVFRRGIQVPTGEGALLWISISVIGILLITGSFISSNKQ